ncbi:DUF1217 domain-containing protein [Pseudooceanicola sp. HF7]|uniref:DUF1217 domain-containing protein n=1 Tax=Pseudooceanicola sp. HF7 TaxID=2721560 RepID=UPI00143180F4|nr:DUF1217 domain-containing protein [Pseudooceanicola sp. HF7]NIZ09736.1 DUF1217 domain-containing protein [Pseudooceanicola sp. HF7]
MTFAPVLPSSGLVGWMFLQRTYDNQKAVFDKSPLITRDTAYFEENISKVDTAEDLVSDRRLLRVALGAFGLQDDINSTYFVKKILEEGTLEEDALANKLSDSRYYDLAAAFGFDRGTPSTKISTFATDITDKFRRQEFEVAVGLQDDSLRLALNADRGLETYAGSEATPNTNWYKIMGDAPLRKVMETALGLPTSFAGLDLEKQLEIFKDRSERFFGTANPAELGADAEIREKVVQRYLMQAQIREYQASSAGAVAQMMLSSAIEFGRSLRPF